MVQIHKKSVVVKKEFFDVALYAELARNALRQDFMEMLSKIDFDITEFPAAHHPELVLSQGNPLG